MFDWNGLVIWILEAYLLVSCACIGMAVLNERNGNGIPGGTLRSDMTEIYWYVVALCVVMFSSDKRVFVLDKGVSVVDDVIMYCLMLLDCSPPMHHLFDRSHSPFARNEVLEIGLCSQRRGTIGPTRAQNLALIHCTIYVNKWTQSSATLEAHGSIEVLSPIWVWRNRCVSVLSSEHPSTRAPNDLQIL